MGLDCVPGFIYALLFCGVEVTRPSYAMFSCAVFCVASVASVAIARPILLGGGNVGSNGDSEADVIAQLGLLAQVGAGSCRTNLYPSSFLPTTPGGALNWSSPNPSVLDDFLGAALARNVTPMLLFEYYAQYLPSLGFGTGDEWAGIGAAFAAYAGPGGSWATAHGAPPGWGVSVFSAINEPDGGSGNLSFLPGGALPGPQAYAEALSGLSRGVKGVLGIGGATVCPGGFMSMNAFGDATLRGLGPFLAPLWNSGILDCIDLHTYYDVQYAPMVSTK